MPELVGHFLLVGTAMGEGVMGRQGLILDISGSIVGTISTVINDVSASYE